jgi:hypothetical protein
MNMNMMVVRLNHNNARHYIDQSIKFSDKTPHTEMCRVPNGNRNLLPSGQGAAAPTTTTNYNYSKTDIYSQFGHTHHFLELLKKRFFLLLAIPT